MISLERRLFYKIDLLISTMEIISSENSRILKFLPVLGNNSQVFISVRGSWPLANTNTWETPTDLASEWSIPGHVTEYWSLIGWEDGRSCEDGFVNCDVVTRVMESNYDVEEIQYNCYHSHDSLSVAKQRVSSWLGKLDSCACTLTSLLYFTG